MSVPFYFLILLLMLSLNKVSATVTCLTGCDSVTTYINAVLDSASNVVGHEENSNSVIINAQSVRMSQAGTASFMGWYSNGVMAESGTYRSDWTYIKIDDYISAALSSTSVCGGTIYFPFNVLNTQVADCSAYIYSAGEETAYLPYSYASRIKVTKKIVNGAYSKNILLGYDGGCQPGGCVTPNFKRAIYVSLNITVPQSCEINAGQVIDIDFGNISVGAFKMAGVAADGVQSKSKTLSITCSNIESNAKMSMRLQADKVSESAVVSDENNDVGFQVMNSNGTTLIPNNISSVIPFTLSDTQQNVTIQVVPVSVTGNKPVEGAVTSRAYLRVDFP